jgi:Protein of unknown function (DUF1566)
MYLFHRFHAALLCLCFALITACNGIPAADVAVDFSINSVKGTISGQNVTIDLTTIEACSNLTSLVASVQASGLTVSPDPAVARDYTTPVAFTLTAPDGSKVVYTVTVKGNSCIDRPVTPTTPTACSAAAIGSTGYSLVFKGCDDSNVAVYYDLTECVRDNATGLIWEGKTTAGLRASENKYNNFDSTSLLQIPPRTIPWTFSSTLTLPARTPTQAEIDDPNNSVGYKNNVNASNLCGYSDWHLPNKNELQSLVIPTTPTLIDYVWFPNTDWDGQYCTSTQFENVQESAWSVQFYDRGIYNQSHTSRDGYVLLQVSSLPTYQSSTIYQNSVRLVRTP